VRHRYFEFNGKKFPFQADLDLTGNFFDFVLTYGDEALEALRQLETDPAQAQMLQELLDQGLLEKFRGRWRLTPRAVDAMQRRALMEVFAYLKKGTREGHDSPDTGGIGERTEGTRPYQFGDPLSEVDLGATLRNTLRRMATRDAAAPRGRDRAPNSARPTLLPLQIAPDDFERYDSESRTSCSTVALLDMSGSMARFGRFFQAKKCAMALIALVRQRFPLDSIDVVGFASAAEVIREDKLPIALPKPVTTFDPYIRLRVPLKRLHEAPPHFTNLHLGLLQARQILARRGGENQLIFIITDGQPTAHVQGEYAYLLYPPDKASHLATLKEAFLIAKRGVRIATFALTDDYWDMDWLGFVDDLGRLTRGVTFHCASGDLSSCVMQSYLSGRRTKTFIS